MNTKKKYIAPALSLFMVQTEEGYAGSIIVNLFGTEESDYTNNQQNWDGGQDWSEGDGEWTWDD